MKKKFVSFSALVLVLLMCLPLVLSCQKKDRTDADATGSDTGTVSTEPLDSESEEARLKPKDVNFGGKDFNILSEIRTLNGMTLYFWEGDTAPGDVVDIAIWQRQHLMKATYGVNMKMVDTDGNAYQKFTTCMGASEYICDWLLVYAASSMKAARSGYLYNVKDIPELNLGASYWDQRAQEEYSVGDKLFHLEGEYTYLDDLRTYVVAYNNTIYENLHYDTKYGSPYDLVTTGKWTFGTMMEMAKDLREDINNDGQYNEKDMWGIVSERSGPYYMLLGSGKKFITNKNGDLQFAAEDASLWGTLSDILDQTMELGKSPDVLIANKTGAMTVKGDSEVWKAASAIFEDDRTLFRTTSLSSIGRLSNMDSVYGLLPIPKIDAEQDGYYCWTSPVNTCPLAFPIGTDIHTVAQISEIMNYHSRYGVDSLHVAFFDSLVDARLCRDVKDKNMLEKYVFASKTFDIDTMSNFIGVESIVKQVVNEGVVRNLASELEKKRTSAKENIQKLVLDVNKNSIAVP